MYRMICRKLTVKVLATSVILVVSALPASAGSISFGSGGFSSSGSMNGASAFANLNVTGLITAFGNLLSGASFDSFLNNVGNDLTLGVGYGASGSLFSGGDWTVSASATDSLNNVVSSIANALNGNYVDFDPTITLNIGLADNGLSANYGLSLYAGSGGSVNSDLSISAAGITVPIITFSGLNTSSPTVAEDPEPATWLLLGSGFALLGLIRHRRGSRIA